MVHCAVFEKMNLILAQLAHVRIFVECLAERIVKKSRLNHRAINDWVYKLSKLRPSDSSLCAASGQESDLGRAAHAVAAEITPTTMAPNKMKSEVSRSGLVIIK